MIASVKMLRDKHKYKLENPQFDMATSIDNLRRLSCNSIRHYINYKFFAVMVFNTTMFFHLQKSS